MTDTPSSVTPPPEADKNALVPVRNAPGGLRTCWRAACFAVIVFSLILTAGAWFGYQQFQTLRAQWSAQLAQSQAATAQVQVQVQRALDAAQTQATALARLQADQLRTMAQLQNLERTATRPVTDSTVILLGEISSLVEIAQQSVQLGGNIGTALMALERAQQRLVDRAQWVELQQALLTDIEHLRAVPAVDAVALAARLDDLSALLHQAPLLLPETVSAQDRPPPGVLTVGVDHAPAAGVEDASWWQGAWRQARVWSQQAWQAVARDLRDLIDVRRVDDATALLISPDQAAWLRSTLQHRVAAARLALLMRQPVLWTSELRAVRDALDARFDVRQVPVQQAQTLVHALLNATVAVDVPSLESTRAIAAQREIWSHASQEVQSAAEFGTSDSAVTDNEQG